MSEFLERANVRRVGVHRKQALGDHENAVGRVARADLRQFLSRAFDRIVAEQVNVARRRLRTFLKTGVAERIHDDVVARPDQPLDRAEAGRPSRREQRDVLAIEKLADALFERD